MKTVLAITLLLVNPSFAAGTNWLEAGTLIVFRLSFESSYAQDFERAGGKRFDTVQWWIGKAGAWRVKTYAIDSDIHPHRIETQ